MALDFDEAVASENINLETLKNNTPGSIEELAAHIVETQKGVEEQAEKLQLLQKQAKEELQELGKMRQDLSKLIAFFQDHEGAIQTSMYATSKYVIEEEANKAVAEIKKISAEAENQIRKIEDQVSKAAKKAATKSKSEKVISIVQLLLLILIFIMLLSS